VSPASLTGAYRGEGLPRSVKALGVTSFFQDVASEMVYPLLPAFLASLGGGPALLGAMESVAEGVLALLKGAAGRWSDRLGRRKPFLSAGYGLSALTRPLLAVAGSAAQVVLLRAVDRVAKGLRTAPRDALIAEATEPDQRAYAFSFHRGLDHLGAAVGPLLGAVVLLAVPGNTRLVFALATIPAVIGWLTVQIACRETASAPAVETANRRGASRLPAALWPSLTAFFLFSLGNASDAFLLLRAADLGFSPFGIALLWSAFHVAKWLTSVPSGRLADRIGPRRQILLGWALYAAVYLGFGLASQAWMLLPLFAAYAGFYGLTEGAERALVVHLARGAGAGTSLGAFHFATGIGSLVASLWFGVLWEAYSPLLAFLIGGGLAGAAALVLLSSAPPKPA
jgi:MFS family permease